MEIELKKRPKWSLIVGLVHEYMANNEKLLSVKMDTRDLKAAIYNDENIVYNPDNCVCITKVIEWINTIYIRGQTDSNNYESSWLWYRNSNYKYVSMAFNFENNTVSLFDRNNNPCSIEDIIGNP